MGHHLMVAASQDFIWFFLGVFFFFILLSVLSCRLKYIGPGCAAGVLFIQPKALQVRPASRQAHSHKPAPVTQHICHCPAEEEPGS